MDLKLKGFHSYLKGLEEQNYLQGLAPWRYVLDFGALSAVLRKWRIDQAIQSPAGEAASQTLVPNAWRHIVGGSYHLVENMHLIITTEADTSLGRDLVVYYVGVGMPLLERDKLKEPVLNELYTSRVKRALNFENRSYITQENIQKFLLDDFPTMPSPFFPGKVARAKGIADTEDDWFVPPSTKKLCSVAEKGLPLQYEDHALIFKRAKQLLSSDDMKKIEELGSHKALQKGISYSAKGLAMMLTIFSHLETKFRNKQVPKLGETIALEKAHIAYLDQLEATYGLSKELETINNQLADTEKSLKVREGEIHAKDKGLRAKDKQIQALKGGCYRCCQKASSLCPDTDWSFLEPGSEP
ncbi:hypothetical protein TIFTF001_026547 [Ficus carica]|uniref:Uncharacterized protein n=1 Tax=Ficus carica TaxID=3494 RepID=A0AA88DLD5_FICCA|nr:hypothetical protein TIFTF001_026547 [Ficus carica]